MLNSPVTHFAGFCVPQDTTSSVQHWEQNQAQEKEKARRPPPSKAWKAWRLGPNLPMILPHKRTPVPRSSSVESVASGYPRDASGQLERDQLFINDLAKQLVAELRAACELNRNLGAKPTSDTKADLIHKRAFCNYL